MLGSTNDEEDIENERTYSSQDHQWVLLSLTSFSVGVAVLLKDIFHYKILKNVNDVKNI